MQLPESQTNGDIQNPSGRKVLHLGGKPERRGKHGNRFTPGHFTLTGRLFDRETNVTHGPRHPLAKGLIMLCVYNKPEVIVSPE